MMDAGTALRMGYLIGGLVSKGVMPESVKDENGHYTNRVVIVMADPAAKDNRIAFELELTDWVDVPRGQEMWMHGVDVGWK